VLLHPVVSGGTDRLPHLPDLPQPDHQRGRKCILTCCHQLVSVTRNHRQKDYRCMHSGTYPPSMEGAEKKLCYAEIVSV